MTSDLDEMVRTLTAAGYKITPPPPPRIPNKCFACDITNEDDYLSTYTVVTEGQGHSHGYDHRTLFACEAHYELLTKPLAEIGFVTHYHGGITGLEDQQCPGFRDKGSCPTPEDSPYDRELFYE